MRVTIRESHDILLSILTPGVCPALETWRTWARESWRTRNPGLAQELPRRHPSRCRPQRVYAPEEVVGWAVKRAMRHSWTLPPEVVARRAAEALTRSAERAVEQVRIASEARAAARDAVLRVASAERITIRESHDVLLSVLAPGVCPTWETWRTWARESWRTRNPERAQGLPRRYPSRRRPRRIYVASEVIGWAVKRAMKNGSALPPTVMARRAAEALTRSAERAAALGAGAGAHQ